MKFRWLVLLAIGAFVGLFYFQPLLVFNAARHVYLNAIGMRGDTVTVGPHRIHYLAGGDGPPLVLVHGIAMTGDDWAPLFRTLKKTHRVYALDLLGNGRSAKPLDGDYSIAGQANIVRGFLDAKQLPQADVLGVSMGGWIAVKLAAEHPQRVRRLVLVSSAGFPFPNKMHEASFSPTTLLELRESLALQTDQAGSLPEFVARDILRRSKKKAPIIRASMRAMITGRDLVEGKLASVTMPVLILWGTNDRIIPYAVAARMQRELPQARIEPLEGCGHLAIIECRERALPAIEAFLGR